MTIEYCVSDASIVDAIDAGRIEEIEEMIIAKDAMKH